MRSLIRQLLLLVIFSATVYNAAYSQNVFSRNPGMRTIDSIEMLSGSPRNFQRSLNDAKVLSAFRNAEPTAASGNILAGRLTSNSSSACSDTSGRYFLEKDPLFFYVNGNIRCADGSILAIGQYVNRLDNSISGGFLLKSNDKGVAQWTRLYNSTVAARPFTQCYYYKLLELKDGTLLLAGKSLNPANGHYDLLLTQVDKKGSIIWSKTYASKLWVMNGSGSPDYFYVVDMQQDPSTGDIFFTGPHFENGLNVTRMKIIDGTIVWSNYYGAVSYDFNVPFGMDIHMNDLLVFSKYSGGRIQRSKIDKATGTALENLNLELSDHSKEYLGFTNTDQLVKMDNGHYLLSGKLYRYYISMYDPDQVSPLAHAGIVEVDGDFNFVKAWYFSNSTEAFYPGSNTRLTIRKDGSGLFSMFGNYTSAEVYVQFQADQLLTQRVLSYQNESIARENLSLQTSDNGDLIIKHLRSGITDKGKIEFLNLHLSDTSSNCLGLKDNANFIYPYQMQLGHRRMDAASPNDFTESVNKQIAVSTINLDYIAGCTQQIKGCDTLSLVKKADTICMSSPFSFTVRKNPSCTASILFDYDHSQVQSYTRVNDSLYSFSFKAAGTATIYGSMVGCSLLKDSVKVVVMAAPGTLDLGPDTAICPGNTIALHAKPGFSSYTWQDGSKDSLFNVKQPGLYFVSAVDICGNVLHDTVNVIARSVTAFDLGPDTSLCERDSIALKVPASFTSYRWSPDYRISSLNAQAVFVSPLTDTVYYVKAEASPGCFVEDSVHFTVKHGVPISLGPDKTFCSGESLVLDAGPGFNTYTWSNGTAGQFTTVYNPGNYSVVATNPGACKSADTMSVLHVFANPQPNMGTDSIICVGTVRMITAGIFAHYAWNTGSTDSAITVTATGLYSVTVTDNNNCKGYDSLVISKLAKPPANFLPADTSICTYGKIELKTSDSFSNYLWSTGASIAAISVATAGTYWLQVEDNNHCVGKDSIVLRSRDCMLGFYIPNAFSPGHDGKNDLFRPLIFGKLLQYEFTIYNRFGQVVFTSKQVGKGWDGSSTQSTSAFAWTCRYQLENEPLKFEKGMVLLLR